MPAMSEVRARIRRLRESQGLSQEGLARRADVSVGTIAKLEIGRHEPTLATLEAVARGLGLSVSDLLADEEPEPTGAA